MSESDETMFDVLDTSRDVLDTSRESWDNVWCFRPSRCTCAAPYTRFSRTAWAWVVCTSCSNWACYSHARVYQRRSTEAWKRGTFEMFPEYGCPSWQLLSLAPRCSCWYHLSLTVPVRHTCRIARGVNPTLHHQSVISHHQLTRFVTFFMNSLHFIKECHCSKNGAKRSSSWPGSPIWPISLGCQKGSKTKFHQIRFSACQTIPVHKISTPVMFRVEKRPWVECGGLIRKHSVPKFELDFCPDHWCSPLGLKIHETSSYVV
jgi:hypothetical protein